MGESKSRGGDGRGGKVAVRGGLLMAQNIERELSEQVRELPNHQQRRVLDFARSLAAEPRNGNTTGQALLAHARAIHSNDLVAMTKAIDEGCDTAMRKP